ncbi:MAG: hypothetical protein EAZ41_00875 [Sphingobacteriia bacterium]|nr:MAG: hypothetical protein EAZ41_00875 [Sphingobacteriia bacterium]
MSEDKKLTELESLQLITNMIQKAKGGYHETGIGSLLWGAVVGIASFVTSTRFFIVFKFSITVKIYPASYGIVCFCVVNRYF